MTSREKLLNAAWKVTEWYRRTFDMAPPYPEPGDIISTAWGPYVVLGIGYGGRGSVRTVPLDEVEKILRKMTSK